MALGLAEERIRVLVPEVGGGFGIKGHVYPEEIVVAAVARRLGRPVKWVETRREHFLSAAADRDQDHTTRGSASRATAPSSPSRPTSRGITARSRRSARPSPRTPSTTCPGRIACRTIAPSGRNVVTHKTFAAAYRGAGRPEAAFVLDRLLDRAARAASAWTRPSSGAGT